MTCRKKMFSSHFYYPFIFTYIFFIYKYLKNDYKIYLPDSVNLVTPPNTTAPTHIPRQVKLFVQVSISY